jgi:hypothetical protein
MSPARNALARLRACAGLALLAPGPVFAQATPPCSDAVADLAQELDAAFERGDAEAYLARFDLRHARLRAKLDERIRAVLGGAARLARRSEVSRHWERGEFTVALVRSRTSNPARADLGSLEEHALWAVRGPDDAPRITLAVEVEAAHLEMVPDASDPLQPKHLFRCRACNYTIDAGDQWLMVPTCNARIGCLESLSFYSLQHDLAADLSIHLADGETVPTPRTMLEDLLEDLPEDLPAGEPGRAGPGRPARPAIDPWLPPMYRPDNRPTYLDGARVVLQGGDQRAEVHLATYGRLGYLMVVHGPAEIVERNRGAIDRLMGTFTLQDPALEPEQVVLRITQERQGGLLDGGEYRNTRFGVRFTGPEDFGARMAASHYAFEVRWTRSDGTASVRLKALTPPNGMERWSVAAAERTVKIACDRGGLVVDDPGAWQLATTSADGGGGPDPAMSAGFARERWIRAREGGSGAAPAILLRLALDEDLLVIVEARAESPAAGGVDLRRLVAPLHRDR